MRKRIQQIIESEPQPEQAAFKVCGLLEDEIDLAGNGWFDDDPEMKNWLVKTDRWEPER
ncbi:MAG: hypothetical protein ACJ73N_05610 [Bryobacteraceae bacterium]